MKNAIKVLCFVILVIVAGVSSVYVYFTWGSDYKTIDGSQFGTTIITHYTGDETDVVIPNRIRGKKVISIDENAFSETGITSVKLSNGIVSIGNNAFRECPELVSVDMGKGVESIGNYAFYGSPKLSSVKFSPEVKKVGYLLFGNDTQLKSIDLNGNENFKFIDGALYSADMTTLYETLQAVDFSSYSCPETVTNFNSYAFYGQEDLKSITVNDGVKVIPEGAFVLCKSLTELVLPDSVVSIGTAVTIESGIKTITIPASVSMIDDSAFYNSEKQITIVTTKGSYAAKYAERKGINLKIVDTL